MISIVCVYNDERILNDWFLKSLRKQISGFDLILVDNTSRIFDSAAKGMNYGAKKAKGKYIMFVHQDVSLMSNDWLEKAVVLLDRIGDLGVAGVAGMREPKLPGIYGFGTRCMQISLLLMKLLLFMA